MLGESRLAKNEFLWRESRYGKFLTYQITILSPASLSPSLSISFSAFHCCSFWLSLIVPAVTTLAEAAFASKTSQTIVVLFWLRKSTIEPKKIPKIVELGEYILSYKHLMSKIGTSTKKVFEKSSREYKYS